jgi:hypothetical protein
MATLHPGKAGVEGGFGVFLHNCAKAGTHTNAGAAFGTVEARGDTGELWRIKSTGCTEQRAGIECRRQVMR